MTEKKSRTQYKVPKFFLDVKHEDRPAAIYLKYSYASGLRLNYFTGLRIETSKWNYKLQRVKRNVNGAADMNDTLDKLFEEAQSQVRQHRLLKKPLAIPDFKVLLDNAIDKATVKTDFFNLYDRFVQTESVIKSWTKGTLTKLATIKRQLEDFEKKKKHNIQMSTINDTFFQKLVTFWQEEYNLRNSTINKNISILKWFFKWCYKKGLIGGQYRNEDVKLTEAPKKVIYLEMDELRKIQKMELPTRKKYLDRTRDIFIFQSLTGLRYSDLKSLKANDRFGDHIRITTVKTAESIEIEFNDTTDGIWQKYHDHQKITGMALPVPSNQKYNSYLKELAKLAELNEKISLIHYKGSRRIEETFFKHELICSHTARRSFITNGLAQGIGSEVIRSWTGHKSDESFEKYYEIIKQRKIGDMKKLSL
jgi:integrase